MRERETRKATQGRRTVNRCPYPLTRVTLSRLLPPPVFLRGHNRRQRGDSGGYFPPRRGHRRPIPRLLHVRLDGALYIPFAQKCREEDRRVLKSSDLSNNKKSLTTLDIATVSINFCWLAGHCRRYKGNDNISMMSSLC